MRLNMIIAVAGVLALAALTVSCTDSALGQAIPCSTNADCLPGQWCDVDTELCAGEPEVDVGGDAVGDSLGQCSSVEDCWPHEDDDYCNGFLMCVSGQCVLDPGTVVSCPPSHPCQPNVCNPDTGYCEATTIPGCTLTDCTTDAQCPATDVCNIPICVDGACSSAPRDCSDSDPCTDDYCSATGCQHVTNPDIAGCGEPDECQFAWQCPQIGGGAEPPDPGGDGDGIVLCSYMDCIGGQCVEIFEPGLEVCNDGQDNDCDGLVDCADTDCGGALACGTCATNPIALQCNKWTSVQGLWGGAGIDKYACSNLTMSGAEIAFSFKLPYDLDATITLFSEPFDGTWAMALVGDCTGDACISAMPIEEVEKIALPIVANVPYYFVLDRSDGEAVFYAEAYIECPEVELCFDFIDNDNDGLVDCADPDCVNDDPCQATETKCFDGIDNDGDGYTDCGDPNCATQCANTELNCNDGLDNDNDGYTDCEDGDCVATSACEGGFCGPLAFSLPCNTSIVLPQIPVGGQSYMDTYPCLPGTYNGAEMVFEFYASETTDIQFTAYGANGEMPIIVLQELCAADVCVAASPGSLTTTVFAGNKYFLVAEPPVGAPFVEELVLNCGGPPPPDEVCWDGFDNDGDGLVDCVDFDCFNTVWCDGGDVCQPVAEIQCNEFLPIEPFPVNGSVLDSYSCLPGLQFPGFEMVFEFTAQSDGTIQWWGFGEPFGLTQTFLLEASCDGSSCIATSPDPFEPLTADVKAGVTYYLVVDSMEAFEVWVFDSNLECLAPEQCFDGVDNDNDGKTDCADSDCWNTQPCQSTETNCVDGLDNDGDGGTDCNDLWCYANWADCAVGPPPTCQAVAELECGGGFFEPVPAPPSVLNNYSCAAGNFSGDEVVFEFTAQEDGTIEWFGFAEPFDQTQTFLLEASCDGASCVAAAINMFEPLNAPVKAGVTYYLVIDSTVPGPVWVLDTFMECWAPENCTDGIDNDNDGQIDCADSDCVNAGAPCQQFETECVDGIDNDGDGATDCAEVWCKANSPKCGLNEVCLDGIDNDGDGYTDCGDAECVGNPNCPVQACMPQQIAIACNQTIFDQPFGSFGQIDAYSCSGEQMPGGEQVFYLGSGLAGPVIFSAYTEAGASGRGLLMAGQCNAASCIDVAYAGFDGNLQISFAADPNTEYWVVADSLAPWETYVWEASLSCLDAP